MSLFLASSFSKPFTSASVSAQKENISVQKTGGDNASRICRKQNQMLIQKAKKEFKKLQPWSRRYKRFILLMQQRKWAYFYWDGRCHQASPDVEVETASSAPAVAPPLRDEDGPTTRWQSASADRFYASILWPSGNLKNQTFSTNLSVWMNWCSTVMKQTGNRTLSFYEISNSWQVVRSHMRPWKDKKEKLICNLCMHLEH